MKTIRSISERSARYSTSGSLCVVERVGGGIRDRNSDPAIGAEVEVEVVVAVPFLHAGCPGIGKILCPFDIAEPQDRVLALPGLKVDKALLGCLAIAETATCDCARREPNPHERKLAKRLAMRPRICAALHVEPDLKLKQYHTNY